MAITPADELAQAQRAHWQTTYAKNPEMYGAGPSVPGRYAVDLFVGEGMTDIVELGSGQGRDTLAFLRAGLRVVAMDFSAAAVTAIQDKASAAGTDNRLSARVYDVRQALPLADESADAVYSHMLLCMALSTRELDAICAEIRRVLRPGGMHVYTVRHTGDAHYRAGTSHGHKRWEHGGFVVHFFDRAMVDRLATGMELIDLRDHVEGDLPRRLWLITLRKAGSAT